MSLRHPSGRVPSVRPILLSGILLSRLLTACAYESSPAPQLTVVDPDQVSATRATPVRIRGRHFLGSARLALSGGSRVQVDFAWQVSVGEHEMPGESVSLLDETTLRVLVPPDLPIGLHGVTVVSPSGQRASLEEALEVVEGEPSSPESLLDQRPTDACSGGCAACGAGDCCRNACPGGSCSACAAGCTCDLECGRVDSCTGRCEPGSTCWLSSSNTNGSRLECQTASCALACSNDTSCNLDCESGALCELSCTQSGGCELGCGSGSACLIRCEQTSSCDLDCAEGSVVECGGGVRVCNRPCP